jgi:hypothetical protein
MKSATYRQWLGNVNTEDLLKSITKFNPSFTGMDLLREAAPRGFSVQVEFERDTAENKADEQILRERAEARTVADDPSTWDPKPSKFIQIVLVAEGQAGAKSA